MRFLFISSDTFPPFRVDVSVLFGKEIVSRGHQIDWFLRAESNCTEDYVTNWSGCKVFVGATDDGTGIVRRARKHALGLTHDLKGLLRISGSEFDFVQVKDKFLVGALALFFARLHKVPLVFWLSFPYPESWEEHVRNGTARYPMLYRLRAILTKALLYRVILPGADCVFVQSERMKSDLVLKGVDPRKMTAVPMGIDLHGFPTRSQVPNTRSPTDGPLLAYLGTLSALRKLDFLVRVLGLVRERFPNARLLFVGDGDTEADRSLVEQEARLLGLSNAIDITGFLPRSEALTRTAEADICLSPFFPCFVLNSTSPTKLVEYMALGRPVVASEHPEQSLVVAESQCGICAPWDEQEFARAICDILKAPDEAKAMGDRGRAYVLSHRTYDQIAVTVEQRYLEVTG